MIDHLKLTSNRSLIIYIINILLFSLLQGQSTSLAVYGFSGNGVTSSEATVLANRLRSELWQVSEFKILSSGQFIQILNEQDMQHTGCTSDVCMIEIGQLVGVKMMVIGSIMKIGKLITVNARMINVETGEVVTTSNYDSREGLEHILSFGMKSIAQQLSGIPETAESPLVPADISSESITLRDNCETQIKIAVVEFQETGNIGSPDAGLTIAAWMQSSCTKTNCFEIFERVLIRKIFEEQQLGQTGALDDSTVAKIGEVYGVDAIVTGTISKLFRHYSVIASLIDTRTGRILASSEFKTTNEDEIPNIIDKLAKKLASDSQLAISN